MAWRWTGNKPLPEPMLIQFTDAYMQYQALMKDTLTSLIYLPCDDTDLITNV